MNGIIKWYFGEHMTTDTKLWVHNITSKASLCYGSENWIINRGDIQKLEAAWRLDRQRNPDICNRLRVDNIAEDIKMYQKRWLDHL
jgi:hypothetical protein